MQRNMVHHASQLTNPPRTSFRVGPHTPWSMQKMEQQIKSSGNKRRWGQPPTTRNRKPAFKRDRDSDEPRGERPERSFGDRKPAFKRDGGRSFSDRKPAFKRDRDSDEPRGERPERSFGDRKPAFKRDGGRSFGDRKFGDRKPAFKRDRDNDEPRGERPERSFGDRKPAFKRDGDRSFSDRKPAFKRDRDNDEPRGERPERSFGDRKPAFKRDGGRSFGDRGRGGSRGGRGFQRREENDEPQRAQTKTFEPGKQLPQRRFSIPATIQPVVKAEEATMTFNEFDLQEEIALAIKDAGFTHPTPIQAKSLPFTLKGQDLIGCAQTGTGKTAAFAIPLVTRLINNPEETALILAPTRELASQIVDTIRQLTTHSRDIRNTIIVGGAPFGEQLRSLRQGPRIVVATPGRLVDHLQRKTIDLSYVSFFVLDEADRMFDMGFSQQIDKIVQHLPKERQTLLFSATFNQQVKRLAMNSLKNPKEVFVGSPSSPASGVDQVVVETSSKDKFNILLDELNTREGSILLFTGMKHRADRLADNLMDYGHSVARIHGDRSMGQRKSAIAGFRAQKFRILVATDIAARGLDISHVAHVINYDLPRDPEDYIHRIGRTARAGAKGQAISFVTSEERGAWKRIERLLPRQKR